MNGLQKGKQMDYKQNFKCWYSDVCNKYEEGCERHCIRYDEMLFLVKNSGIPETGWTPITLTPVTNSDYTKFKRLSEIKESMKEFVNDGNNLYITSQHTGNGKTSWAIKLMLKYFNDIWAGNGFRVRGLFIHVPTLLLQLKNFNKPLSEEYKQNILDADLVVWDDIACAELSSYDYSNLLMFLENRLLRKKSNIFTSNRNTKEELNQNVGARLTSRIWETSEIIEFKGKDRR